MRAVCAVLQNIVVACGLTEHSSSVDVGFDSYSHTPTHMFHIAVFKDMYIASSDFIMHDVIKRAIFVVCCSASNCASAFHADCPLPSALCPLPFCTMGKRAFVAPTMRRGAQGFRQRIKTERAARAAAEDVMPESKLAHFMVILIVR